MRFRYPKKNIAVYGHAARLPAGRQGHGHVIFLGKLVENLKRDLIKQAKKQYLLRVPDTSDFDFSKHFR